MALITSREAVLVLYLGLPSPLDELFGERESRIQRHAAIFAERGAEREGQGADNAIVQYTSTVQNGTDKFSYSILLEYSTVEA